MEKFGKNQRKNNHSALEAGKGKTEMGKRGQLGAQAGEEWMGNTGGQCAGTHTHTRSC